MKTIAERIIEGMEIRDMKQVDIIESTGINKGSLSSYISGKYEPKQTNIYKIAKALNVSEAWLMGHDVPMDRVHQPKENTSAPIPLIGTIAAGTPILAQENIEDYFYLDSKVKADFALRVKGDSMINAGIYEGDIVFIRKQETIENGEIGAILIDNEATLKRFYKQENTIVLQAENDSFKPMIFTDGNIRILGKLVAVLNIME